MPFCVVCVSQYLKNQIAVDSFNLYITWRTCKIQETRKRPLVKRGKKDLKGGLLEHRWHGGKGKQQGGGFNRASGKRRAEEGAGEGQLTLNFFKDT